MMTRDERIVRATAAAAARWGERRLEPSVRIRVDESAAHALEAVPEADRRSVASDAIRRAVDEYRSR